MYPSILVLAALVLGPLPVDGRAPGSSALLASVKAYEAAANRHDWQRLQPLIADELVIDLGDGLSLVGRESASRLHEWEWAMGTRIAYSNCQASGTSVTCQATEENDFLRAAGLGPIRYETATLTFVEGRVVRLSSVLSEESAGRVGEFMGGFLTWAQTSDPKGTASFLNGDGSFTFERSGAMALKRLVRAYVQAKAGRSRAI
jgi:hypothetical protein